jgi:hypothetical protein
MPQGLRMKASAEHVFAFLENAAAHEDWCPTNPGFALELSKRGINLALQSIPGVFRKPIRAGLITVRLYGHNWREVIIQRGPPSLRLYPTRTLALARQQRDVL